MYATQIIVVIELRVYILLSNAFPQSIFILTNTVSDNGISLGIFLLFVLKNPGSIAITKHRLV